MVDAGGDPALAALRNLAKALETNEARSQLVRERASEIERLREQGYSWRDIISTEPRPLVVTVVGHTVEVLAETGARFRRIEAKGLRAEGVKVEEIADLFSLPPDRVEAMLAEPD